MAARQGGYAVAAGSRLAAEAAAEVLQAGGTAVDAVVAAALAACVAEPVLASLMGGGCLMLLDRGGKTRLLDGFVQTPRRPRPPGETDLREIVADFGDATQTFHIGAGSIATPGLGALLAEAHARAGLIPMRELSGPACAAARAGTPIEAFQARVLDIVCPIYRASPAAQALYLHGADRAPEPGTPIRNAALADVIETFAAEGERFLMEGEPGAALVALCEDGGHLTQEDLRRYRPVWRAPLTVSRATASIALNPAPALGGALIGLCLDLLADRAPVRDRARVLAALDTARREVLGADDIPAALADPGRVAALRAALARPQAPRGTTHVSVIDQEGMAAGLSLSNGEGCGLVLDGIGIMPNNMLGEADLVPEPGAFHADTRLATMMAPSTVSWPDGRVAVLGSGGSTRIPGAISQVLAGLIDHGERLEDAIAAPRLHVHEGALDFEDRFAAEDREALMAAWPEARAWRQWSMYFGGVHGAARDARGGVEAAPDPRRDGTALTG
jgi:gamma-glutamyltranspeptidase/glutathione hydrolase